MKVTNVAKIQRQLVKGCIECEKPTEYVHSVFLISILFISSIWFSYLIFFSLKNLTCITSLSINFWATIKNGHWFLFQNLQQRVHLFQFIAKQVLPLTKPLKWETRVCCSVSQLWSYNYISGQAILGEEMPGGYRGGGIFQISTQGERTWSLQGVLKKVEFSVRGN